VAVNFNKDTGFFNYIYRIVTPETRDTAFKGLRVVASIAKDIKAIGIKLDEQDQPSIDQIFTWLVGKEA